MSFKHLRAVIAALLLTVAFAATGWAVVDRAICSTADAGATCTGTEIIANANEELTANGNALPLVLGSVAGTDTITATTTPAITAYVDGQLYHLKPAVTNTAAVTLNIASIAAKAVVDPSGTALTAGDLQSTTVYLVRYFASNDEFRVLTNLGTGVVYAPTGTVTYLTTTNTASLSAERALTAGIGLSSTDGGANSTLTTNFKFTDTLAGNPALGVGGCVFTSETNSGGILCEGSASDNFEGEFLLPDITGADATQNIITSASTINSLAASTSANLRTLLSDETGTGAAMFGLTTAMADELSCTGSQVVRRNAGDTAFECATPAGSGDALVANPLSQFAATTSLQLLGVLSNETGTGAAVFADTPTLIAPLLGTPTSGVLTNATGLPIGSGVSGLGAGVATALATPSSANLRTAFTDETGTGAAMFGLTTAMADDLTCTGAQVVRRNAGDTAFECATPSSGTVTSVATSTGLTGGAITTTGTLSFDYSDAGASPSLGADESRFTSNATVPGMLVFEGDTADAFESRVIITDPTADRDFTIPNADSVAVQPLTCGAGDFASAVSALGAITCGTPAGGSGDAVRVEDGDDAGTYTAATDADFGDSGDINFALNTTPAPDEITATVRADSVALSTDTTGNYAAGDAEAGAATTGDSATAFFAAGALEIARGGNGAAPAGDDQVMVSTSTSAGAFGTLPDSDGATQKLQYDQTTNAFSAGTDDDVPESGDFAGLTATAPITQAAGVISTSIATGTLVGRTTAAAGVMEAITPDATLSLAALALSVVDVTCTGCLGATEIAALDAGDTTTGAFADARVDGSAEADEVNPTLGTQTQGNFQTGNTAGAGIAITQTPAEGFSSTVALDYTDQGASPALAADACQFTSNATTPGMIVCEGDTADAFETRVIITDPTADRAFTIPNADSAAVQPLTCGGTDKVSAISADGVVTCTADAGAAAGDNVTVNGVAAVDVDLDDATPAAVSGTNVLWQKDAGAPNNVSAYVPASSVTVIGAVELATTAEAAAQTDSVRAITAAGLAFKPESLCVAASDETTLLTTGTAKVTFRMPYAFTVTDVRGSLSTVATGATLLTVDVNEAGVTIISTKLTFDASESTTTTAATPRVISDSALADDAQMTIDIDAVGNTTAGKGIKVCLIGHQ